MKWIYLKLKGVLVIVGLLFTLNIMGVDVAGEALDFMVKTTTGLVNSLRGILA